MAISGKNIPLEESQEPSSKKQQDFHIWLRSLPLGVLQDLYSLYTSGRKFGARRDGLDNQQVAVSNSDTEDKQSQKPEKIILRRSVFLLVLNFVFIEIFFDAIYIGIRIPAMYLLPANFQAKLTAIYFLIFIILNLLKLIFITLVAIVWVTTNYEITKEEIRYKRGIFSRHEKTFLCVHTQEVTYDQGLIGRLFNFGSIEIYNPALKETIYIESVPNPSKYADIIKSNIPTDPTLQYIMES